jgi:hypothetical protein
MFFASVNDRKNIKEAVTDAEKTFKEFGFDNVEIIVVDAPSDEEIFNYKKGGQTKPKDPVIVRGFSDDEGYEYGKGGKPKMVRYYFEDEEYEFAKGGGVPKKDYLLTNSEAPVPVYTYLPNVKRELHEDLWRFFEKAETESEREAYLEKTLRLSINGKFFYDMAINVQSKGYPLILQQAIRCKKYLESIGYKVAIGENFTYNFRQLQEGYFNVYTDKKVPATLWEEMNRLGIASYQPYYEIKYPNLD